jgi:hypothetical protein
MHQNRLTMAYIISDLGIIAGILLKGAKTKGFLWHFPEIS